MNKGSAVSSLLLLISVTALGATSAESSKTCKGNPALKGTCYVIHGRATFGNGTPALRIWPIGTKRMLGVTNGKFADDAEDPTIPKNLHFDPSQKAFGDFEVCPFTVEQPGHMQMVCVQSAKNLVIK
jgi:hypothetical protein